MNTESLEGAFKGFEHLKNKAFSDGISSLVELHSAKGKRAP